MAISNVGAIRFRSQSMLLPLIALIALFLSACGGATSSGSTTATATATATATPTPTPKTPSVYTSAGDNALYALRADNGAVRWKYQATKLPQIMALGSSAIYIIDPADELLSAISQTDGALLWKSQAQVCYSVSLTSDAARVFVPVVQHEGSAFTPMVYALDVKKGTMLWKAQAGAT